MKFKNIVISIIVLLTVCMLLILLFTSNNDNEVLISKNNIFDSYNSDNIKMIKFHSQNEVKLIKERNINNFINELKSIDLVKYEETNILFGGYPFDLELSNGDIKHLIVYTHTICFDNQYYTTSIDICDKLKDYFN